MNDFLILFAGLCLLALGGDFLVRGSVGVAKRLGVSPLVIGLTLVGFGTSMPELATTINAVLQGSPDVAFGNIIGSNISNILLILGVAAILVPITCDPRSFKRDGTSFALSQIVFVGMLLTGFISRPMAFILLGLLMVYLVYTYVSDAGKTDSDTGAEPSGDGDSKDAGMNVFLGLFLTVIGIAGTIYGAQFVVTGATSIAKTFGISEAVIGLTIVAIGTSLPELASAIVAAMKKHGDIAFGNVIGSNIFNSLGILGATAMVEPLSVPARMLQTDVWVMVGVSVLLVIFSITSWSVSRREGLFLLLCYVAYLTSLALAPQ